jgi:hypothetical protein
LLRKKIGSVALHWQKLAYTLTQTSRKVSDAAQLILGGIEMIHMMNATYIALTCAAIPGASTEKRAMPRSAGRSTRSLEDVGLARSVWWAGSISSSDSCTSGTFATYQPQSGGNRDHQDIPQ